jgi:hypothetical protein
MAKPTRSQRKSSGTSRAATVKSKARVTKATHIDVVEPAEAVARPALPSAWRISRRAVATLWQYRNYFLLLGAVYLALDLLLVRSVAAFDVTTLKAGLSSSLSHGAGVAVGGLSVFSSLFSAAASGASADATGAYHFFLVVLMSLVVIWSLRQVFTASEVAQSLRIKNAFYQSTTPFVPFLLILLLIGLQFIPLFIALQIYSLIVGGGIANTGAEQLIFLVMLLTASALTLFWLTRSAIALYIVTLPSMQPMQAFKSAKDLVRGRRLSIVRKLLFLPFALFVLAAIIIVPCIIIWAPLAQWLFFVLTAAGFILVHAYMYTLYRELLNE